MSRGHRVDASRIAAIVAAGVAQIALLSLLLTPPRPMIDVERHESTTITFFPFASEPERPAGRQPSSSTRPPRQPQPLTPRTSSAPSAIPHIDWSKEATRSVERQIVAADEAERQASAFARRGREGGIPLDTAPAPKPEFGWSHARTHRIERSEDGGIVLWLNDRCLIVLTALFPVCSLGKPRVNGALFEHMRDPPELGDWKD